MRLVFFVPIAVCVAMVSTVSFADDDPELLATTSENVTFALDTLGNPRTVTSAEVLALTYRAGSSVLAWAPDSAASETLVADAAEVGTVNWLPTAGGLWSVENSLEGVATFYVRYSLFPSEDTGTLENPARVVDDAELSDMVASGKAAPGFSFVPYGMTTIDTLALPDGYALMSVGNGVYQLASSTDGLLYDSSALDGFDLDTEKPGPDRVVLVDEPLSVAYSGDNWVGAVDAVSALTMVSPSGVSELRDCSGTGVVPFQPTEIGTWKVSLVAGGVEYTALLRARNQGTVLCVR